MKTNFLFHNPIPTTNNPIIDLIINILTDILTNIVTGL